VNGLLVNLPVGRLVDLAADPNVKYISLDRPVRPSLDNATPAVAGDLAQGYGYSGRGVGVAVLDSGITPGDDLRGRGLLGNLLPRVIYSESFIGGGTADRNGHGTHIAGIIGGNGADSNGNGFTKTFRGVAPDVHLINLRVLDEQARSTDSIVIKAIERAIQLRGVLNIRVMNLSLGRPVVESYRTDPLCQAVEAAWRSGIVVVVSGGNLGRNYAAGTNGYGTITSPGNDPYVITVGAMKTMGTPTRNDDAIASYSSKGPTFIDHIAKPDIVAPGNRVISSRAAGILAPPTANVPNQYYMARGTGVSSDYVMFSGTSMAAGVVSGAVALLLEKTPSLTPDQVKARLMKTAFKQFPAYSIATDLATGQTYRSQHDLFTVGAGYLDVAAALASNERAVGRALSPPAWRVRNATYILTSLSTWWSQTALRGETALWGETGPWSQTSVWGATVVPGASRVQGTTVLWGESALWGEFDSALWGEFDSALWGEFESALWGEFDSALWGETIQNQGER
jgi:serine protease AprX